MIKVAWLCPYNINHLLPELKLNRKICLHNASWIQNLSESLALLPDIELHVITHSQAVDATQTIRKNGIIFHVVKYNLPFTNKGFPPYLPFDKLTSYAGFAVKGRKVIEEIKPDVVHVHGTEGAYFAPTKNLSFPCIISIQGIVDKINEMEPTLSGYLQIPIERKTIKSGKFFGCRTQWDEGYIKEINNQAKIFDLPEAMNFVFFKEQWKNKLELNILFVGSVIKRKGIEDLIHAVGKLYLEFPLIRLRIIGTGDKKYIRHLQTIIKSYNIEENVDWLGNRSSQEIAKELSTSTCFVLPTLIDNSPNSLAEAMAVGVPSIATKVGGIPSMIKHEHDGLLVTQNDIKELTSTIKRLLSDIQLQEKLSINARNKAFERNYPPNVAKKYLEVYKTLLNERS